MRDMPFRRTDSTGKPKEPTHFCDIPEKSPHEKQLSGEPGT